MDESRKQRLQVLGEMVDNHCWDNRAEIDASDQCLCTGCGLWLVPTDITRWYEGKHACCPECGLAGAVVGSKSGIPLDEYRSNMNVG